MRETESGERSAHQVNDGRGNGDEKRKRTADYSVKPWL